MVRLARAELFDPSEVAILHVIGRVTRRCFLFGFDPVSGKNFDHSRLFGITGRNRPHQPSGQGRRDCDGLATNLRTTEARCGVLETAGQGLWPNVQFGSGGASERVRNAESDIKTPIQSEAF